MSDFEVVKAAMQMVAKHKFPSRELREEDFNILAEAAVKAMYLAEAGTMKKFGLTL